MPFIGGNKPDPFYKGQSVQRQVTAEQLNRIRELSDRQLRGAGGTDVKDFGDRVTINTPDLLPAAPLPDVSNYIAQFVILAEYDDYLACTPYIGKLSADGTHWIPQVYDASLGLGQPQITYIAKPYGLQRTPWDGQTVIYDNGQTITYNYVSAEKRYASTGGATTVQTLMPGYAPGLLIFAVPSITGYQDPSGQMILWTDINDGGLFWSSDTPDTTCQFTAITALCWNGSTLREQFTVYDRRTCLALQQWWQDVGPCSIGSGSGSGSGHCLPGYVDPDPLIPYFSWHCACLPLQLCAQLRPNTGCACVGTTNILLTYNSTQNAWLGSGHFGTCGSSSIISIKYYCLPGLLNPYGDFYGAKAFVVDLSWSDGCHFPYTAFGPPLVYNASGPVVWGYGSVGIGISSVCCPDNLAPAFGLNILTDLSSCGSGSGSGSGSGHGCAVTSDNLGSVSGSGAANLSLGAITVPPGKMLVVGVGARNNAGVGFLPHVRVTLGGVTNLNKHADEQITCSDGSTLYGGLWYYPVTVGVSSTLEMTITGVTPTDMTTVLFAIQLNDLPVFNAGGSGTNYSPNGSPQPNLSVLFADACNYVQGLVVQNAGARTGSWANSFAGQGQDVSSSNISLYGGFLIPTVTGNTHPAMTGAVDEPWILVAGVYQ